MINNPLFWGKRPFDSVSILPYSMHKRKGVVANRIEDSQEVIYYFLSNNITISRNRKSHPSKRIAQIVDEFKRVRNSFSFLSYHHITKHTIIMPLFS